MEPGGVVLDYYTPNFTPIGAKCRPYGAKNLKIPPPSSSDTTGWR